jgi:hypothetical protein
MRSIAFALALVFGLSIQAFAARVVLDPMTQPAPGPQTFKVLLLPDEGEFLPSILDADISLFFSGDLLAVSATPTGNPFLVNAGFVTTIPNNCSPAPLCAYYGGTDFGAEVLPNFGNGWLLGDLTVQSNGGTVDVIVNSFSRYTSSIGSIGFSVSNQNAVAGTLPEPSALVLLAVSVLALGAAGRTGNSSREEFPVTR